MASGNDGSVRCSWLDLDVGAPLHRRFLVGRALKSPRRAAPTAATRVPHGAVRREILHPARRQDVAGLV